MDNARIHHASIVVNLFNLNGKRLIFLPPYSPQLNPIEEVF
jgi:transposase